jgi:superfamily I DNA and RNA helicase
MLDEENYIYTLANVLEAKCQNSLDWQVNKAYESKNKISGQLLVSNRNNVKGLEYPFVICLTMKLVSDYPYRNAIYTMLSRSFIKSYLLVPTIDNGITESIKKGLKEIKRNHQMTIRIPSEQEIQSIQTRFTRAKERKPLAEIVDGLLIEMKVGKEKRNRIIDFTTNLGWEGYSEEEIKTKLVKIVEIL